jgi:TIR domain
MADLFLSYAHQDVERAEALARFLEANGLTVWWDRRMVAGDKIHDVIDEEIEKAKAVIVLWSSISVKSDWVRGEAQTAHELAKLVPIKIAECKLPINYRGIHTPEVYKSKAERDRLAQMLSDKFKTAQPLLGGTTAQLPRRPTAEPSTAPKIEFSDKSSSDFLTRLDKCTAQFESFSKEWRPEDIFTREGLRLIKKHPFSSLFAYSFLGLIIFGLLYLSPSATNSLIGWIKYVITGSFLG